MAKFDKKLAQILSRRELVGQEMLDSMLNEVEQDGEKSLSELLIERNVVDEEVIIGTLAEEMNLPPINLNKVDVAKEALDVIPEDLARYYKVLPVSKIGDVLTIAVANPFDIFTIDDVKIVTGHELLPVVSTDYSIKRAIEKAYNRDEAALDELMQGMDSESALELTKEEEGDEDIDMDAVSDDEENPVVKLVNLIIVNAIKQRASDIHVEIYEKRTRVRYRVDGALFEAMSPPRKLYKTLVTRVKVMCPTMRIDERQRPQDGRFQMRFENRKIDFRVSSLPTVYGEKIVIRILDSSSLKLSLDELGFEQRALDDFRKAVEAPYGMLLVTGPTGSGKSTTLYSAIREVLNEEDNISTVEDPVEYELEGVNQVAINVQRGLTFAGALRSLLRQDPDTIMVGEIRDQETAEIAIRAALTGHLVLSTLHTNDAPSTVIRLVDMGVDAFLVSSSVLLVSAQRLVRTLCQECKKAVKATEEAAREWGYGDQEIEQGIKVFEPGGCSRCTKGYKGRMAMLETMPMSEEIRRRIVAGKSTLDIRAQALEEGMITLRRAGLNNVLKGLTSMDEVNTMTLAEER